MSLYLLDFAVGISQTPSPQKKKKESQLFTKAQQNGNTIIWRKNGNPLCINREGKKCLKFFSSLSAPTRPYRNSCKKVTVYRGTHTISGYDRVLLHTRSIVVEVSWWSSYSSLSFVRCVSDPLMPRRWAKKKK